MRPIANLSINIVLCLFSTLLSLICAELTLRKLGLNSRGSDITGRLLYEELKRLGLLPSQTALKQ